MLTSTSKAILGPLADSVSALIVIISDAESNGTPMPDLSALSQSLEANIKNLLGVAGKIVEQSKDKELVAAMPLACEEVTQSSQLLVGSTQLLATDPLSQTGRNQLLEAVKGVLSGTTRVLDVFDDSEVRRIISASTSLRQTLSRLRTGLNPLPPLPNPTQSDPSSASPQSQQPITQKEYIQFVKMASQTVVDLAQLSTKRINELLADSMKSQLGYAIATLTQTSPMIVSACKLVLTAAEDQSTALAVMAGVCDRMFQACLRIEEIVLWKGDDAPMATEMASLADPTAQIKSIMERRRLLAAELRPEIFSSLMNSHPAETQKLYENFTIACTDNLASLAEAFSNVSDPKLRDFAEKVAIDTEANTQRLAELATESRNPKMSDAALDAEVPLLVKTIEAGFDTLETTVNRGIVGELITTLSTLSDINRPGTTISTLSESAKSKNAAALASSASQFVHENQKLSALVQYASTVAVGQAGTSPKLVQELHTHQARLEDLRPAVSIATSLVIANPSDTIAQEHLGAVIKAYTDTADDLKKAVVSQEGVFSADDLILGAKIAFDYHNEALRKAILANDRPRMLEHLVALQSAAAQYIAIAEKERELTEDAVYKSELDMKLKVVQAVLPGLLSSVQSMMSQSTPISASSAQFHELDLIMENLSVQLSSLAATVSEYKGGRPETLAVPAAVPVGGGVGLLDEPNSISQQQGKQDLGAEQALVDAAIESPTRHSRAEDEGLRALRQAVTETVAVDAAAPQLLDETEAAQQPLKAAGQELRVEASYWATEGNPIVAAVESMSRRMLDLAEFHGQLAHGGIKGNTVAKRDFIKAAQLIMLDAANLVAAAQPLVDACADKRLRMQLQGTLTYVTTLAQQLKIVAAVKASSPLDTDKSVQLVSCAQNLMRTVKAGLRDCVACSLRVKKLAGSAANSEQTAAAAAFKFRKALYRM
eukprot:jgi/Hompol1/6148/HPOL_002653-RA